MVSHDGLKPTKEAREIAGVNAGLDDIFGNNCAGSYDHMVADRNRQDGCICSDTQSLVDRQSSGFPAGPPVTKRSLINIAPCEMKQSSPIVTSSQMNEWDWIRQRFPIFAPFWTSTKGPMNVSSPMSQPYKFAGSMTVTFAPNFTSTIPTVRRMTGFIRKNFDGRPRH